MKNLGVLWLVVFISLMGFGVTIVPFPLVVEQMGGSDFWKTFGGGGVFSVFQLIATPLWGRYSDSLGRKPILVASLVGSVFANVWLASADNLTSLMLARALGGIMSGNLSAAFAYATDVTDPRDRARGLGIVTSAFGVGFAVGPAVGGFLGMGANGQATLLLPGLVSAGVSLVALLGAIVFLTESLPQSLRRPLPGAAQQRGAVDRPASPPARSPLAALAARPVLLSLMLAALLVSLGGAAMQSVLQFWSRDLLGLSLLQVGLQFAFFAVCSVAGQAGLIGPLAQRFGERRVAVAAAIAAVVGLLLFAVARDATTAWLAIGVFGLSLGLFGPAVTSLVSFEADPRERGAVMGAFNAASSAGRIVGPAMSGPLYFSINHSAPFVASAVLGSVGALLLLRSHTVTPTAALPPAVGDS